MTEGSPKTFFLYAEDRERLQQLQQYLDQEADKNVLDNLEVSDSYVVRYAIKFTLENLQLDD